jgi:hypothetical protein
MEEAEKTIRRTAESQASFMELFLAAVDPVIENKSASLDLESLFGRRGKNGCVSFATLTQSHIQVITWENTRPHAMKKEPILLQVMIASPVNLIIMQAESKV